MTTKTFTAVLHKEEDMYVAACPEIGTLRGILIQAKVEPEDFIGNL